MNLTKEGTGVYETRRLCVASVQALPEVVEACDASDCQKPHFWSIYEQQTLGGALCVADCPTERLADAIAMELNK